MARRSTRAAVLIASLCVIAAAYAQPPAGGGTFTAAVSYPTGQYPWSVAAGHFNADGYVDLVTANAAGWVSVLRANGDGSFQAPAYYRAGAYPRSAVVGDFNGDGRDDVLAPNEWDYFTVLLNRGDGTFADPVRYDVSPRPSAVAVGDFNEDGRDDVAVGSISIGGIGVYLSNADGTLVGPAVHHVGPPYPGSTVVADFDGDSHLDLVAAAGFGLHLLRGHGDGTFEAATRLIDVPSVSLVTGDFNGDGAVDLAAAAQAPTNIQVLLGNGDGTFAAPVTYGSDLYPAGIAAGDLNGDGRDDLVVVTYLVNWKFGLLFNGDVAVMLASEGGALGPAIHYGAGGQPRGVIAERLDGDARVDLAVVSTTGFTISVLLNGPVTTTTWMHVSNIDAHTKLAVDGARWHAQVLVRAESVGRAAPSGTLVSGAWDDGTPGSCVTQLPGTCVITRLDLPAGAANATFRVTGLSNTAYPEYGYDPAGNYDSNGDSDGTSIIAARP